MDPHKRKILLICVGIFLGSYVMRFIGNFAMQMEYRRRQAAFIERQNTLKAVQQKAKEEAKVPPAALTSSAVAPPSLVTPKPEMDPVFAKLAGVWQGVGGLQGRGICSLRFEIEPRDQVFIGHFKMPCTASSALMSAEDRTAANIVKMRLNPESADLVGVPDNGKLIFTIDSATGKDIHGCAIASATATPSGFNFIDLAWTENTCAGGHIMLRRMGR